MHAGRDPADVPLAHALPEPATDDHRLGIDQVDRRGDTGTERLHRSVYEPRRQVVAVLQRSLPDPAGEPVATVLLHELEEIRLGALLDLLARLDLHRHAAGVGLHAALAAASAPRTALLDDHVTDFRSCAPSEPRLTVEDQPAADAG